MAGEQFVAQHGKRIDIGKGCLLALRYLLRAQICRRSPRIARDSRCETLLNREYVGHSKVTQIGVGARPGKQNIFRFDITVDEAGGVSGIYSRCGLFKEFAHGRKRVEGPLAKQIANTSSFAIRQDDERTAVRVRLKAIIENGQDVWMTESDRLL